MSSTTLQSRARRQHRIRTKLQENVDRPRLSLHRSNQWMEVQVIDAKKSHTVVGINERVLAAQKGEVTEVPEEFRTSKRMEQAFRLGLMAAQKAKEQGVTQVQFDRSGYRYHGRVRAVAEGARAGGLQF